jgi:hypothetical protein
MEEEDEDEEDLIGDLIPENSFLGGNENIGYVLKI